MKWDDNDPGFDDKRLLLESVFWLVFGTILIVAFSLGLAKIGG